MCFLKFNPKGFCTVSTNDMGYLNRSLVFFMKSGMPDSLRIIAIADLIGSTGLQ
jgi:hypothetical protein